VEGIADFVVYEDDLALNVIPQLELSLRPLIANLAVNVESHEAIEIAPFPLRNLPPGIASTFFVRSAAPLSGGKIVVTGQYPEKSVESVVEIRPGSEFIAPCLRLT
jgi:hypothetical protein